ncbi:predicted flavin-nucleotide-binding protein structurally related to pyridoxine 5'-phosphate oxidase [Hahella chejuensis KCTC 2396]|uniref:Predicted flavin-nucleotide-binding protein structurally related to pyridoxine 5'-phosphate oxidase n=1 Tax=Hahella chejuensis (strain KCTC 2396) TaxID=349521 RepID=Q2SHS8_HAHCH|nr:pyridoxamine 5'-phosphate oxidase family protein [Hahella chejuensis]ABC29796.1 predicted flavin-nucleotide-binding protein structurally related to pyridoxine 5'-phosphate oxidase [Hahella chejuensis KCTC 2396]
MKLDIQEYANKSVLCWLATSSLEGEPNVSPKEIFLALNPTTILIANIASPISERNIRNNPRVCVSYIDVFEQRGCKIKGAARVVEPADPEWNDYLNKLKTLAGENFPIKNIFEISISKCANILAPSYLLFPEVNVEQQIESAKKAYGVEVKAD